MNIITIR